MKKIFFVFLLIASLHAQTIHESKDYYLSNDEVFYETKLNNSDFFVSVSESVFNFSAYASFQKRHKIKPRFGGKNHCTA